MKRGVMYTLALAVAVGLAVTQVARAADDDRGRKEDKGDVDQHFVQMASASGMAEVNLGTMAARMASNPEVRRFAQKLVADHTKANQELLQIANQKNLRLPERMDKKHQDMAKKFGDLERSRFDKEFLTSQVKDHEEAVKLFERETKDGKDEDLRAFAKKHLPHLKEHLKMAQDLSGEGGRDRDRDRSGGRSGDRERNDTNRNRNDRENK